MTHYNLLACGSNGNFQLGLGDDEDKSSLVEINVTLKAPPRSFAFGGNHTLILLDDGTVMAAGSNEYGQCGIKASEALKEFIEIPGTWKFIAAGWEYSVLVDEQDRVYTCGTGLKGELGLGKNIVLSETPCDVKFSTKSPVLGVKSSINHVIVMREDGTYGWGACRKGQLGEVKEVDHKNKPVSCYWEPKKLPLEGTLVAMGHDRTVLYDGSVIKVLGKNACSIEAPNANNVQAMWSSVHWSTSTRSHEGIEIYSQGNNLHGQLYQYNNEASPVDVVVGSEHGLVLLSDGKVCAWGWGEHGNCGEAPETKKKGENDPVTYDYLNEIYRGPDKVVGMAAGCATSWIVTETLAK